MNPDNTNIENIQSMYNDSKKFTSETNKKVNSLAEENQRLNSIIQQVNSQNRSFQNIIYQNESTLSEKDREITFLNNKITFMEDQQGNASNNDPIIKQLNTKLLELNEENQNAYNLIFQKKEENSNLIEQISQLQINNNEQQETIDELNTLLQEANVKLFYNVANISKLQKELDNQYQIKSNYEQNIEKLLSENTKLQNCFIDITSKTEASLNSISQEIEKKDLIIIDYEKMLSQANEKIIILEAEKGNLTVGYALENLKNKDKASFEKEKLQDLVSTTDVIDNLNKLLSDKIDENNFFLEEIENLKSEINKRDSEKVTRCNTIDKQQKNLEKLLLHITSLNQIIDNQKNKISSFNNISTIAFSLIEEFKLFGKFLYKESKIDKDFNSNPTQDYFREKFNEFRMIFKDQKESIKDLKDKLFYMVMINENLIKIIENQSEEEPKTMASDEREHYEAVINNLKNKIYLILDENSKLNAAFEKNDPTKIFKSWTETREKLQDSNTKNELAIAKKNILLLLKNNKDLLDRFNSKNEKINIFPPRNRNIEDQDEKINHLLSENKEKYTFQINSFKKQITILKEMNKNRGLVIENLLKKLKNQRN